MNEASTSTRSSLRISHIQRLPRRQPQRHQLRHTLRQTHTRLGLQLAGLLHHLDAAPRQNHEVPSMLPYRRMRPSSSISWRR